MRYLFDLFHYLYIFFLFRCISEPGGYERQPLDHDEEGEGVLYENLPLLPHRQLSDYQTNREQVEAWSCHTETCAMSQLNHDRINAKESNVDEEIENADLRSASQENAAFNAENDKRNNLDYAKSQHFNILADDFDDDDFDNYNSFDTVKTTNEDVTTAKKDILDEKKPKDGYRGKKAPDKPEDSKLKKLFDKFRRSEERKNSGANCAKERNQISDKKTTIDLDINQNYEKSKVVNGPEDSSALEEHTGK